MTYDTRPNGFTIVEMIFAVFTITCLAVIFFVMVNSYKDRRMSEQAAKVLMQATNAQEEFFTKHSQYFDAEVSGNGGDSYLATPDGGKTSVHVPSGVILSLKAVGENKSAFVGHAFYTQSRVLHRYDSRSGKIKTVERTPERTG